MQKLRYVYTKYIMGALFVWWGSHSGSGGVFAEFSSHMLLFKKIHMRLWFGGCASGIVLGLWLNGMLFL